MIVYVCCNTARAQDYRISSIPDSLKKNAHAVIRFDSIYLHIPDQSGYTFSEEKVISVLDASLEKLAYVAIPYRDKEVVYNFKAWLYDADGNLVKRYDATELVDISLNGTKLAGSDRLKMLDMHKIKAPFTIRYAYDKTASGTAFMPIWVPILDLSESIEHAKLTVNLKPDIHIHFNPYRLNTSDSTAHGYSWGVNGLVAIKTEDYAPEMAEVLPRLDMMLDDFEIYGTEGSAKSWNDLGKFVSTLNRDNDELKHVSEPVLKNIFESQMPDIGKVKALFSYMEHNFHYADIEAGISGWQPEEASTTLKKKYGDCKGLVTVLKALLKKAGIESYYTLVNADKDGEHIDNNFPSLARFNHVILCVPFHTDTVWLECTSPVAPFDYLYKSVTGHKGLLVYNGGGRLIAIPARSEAFNKCISTTHIKLNDDNTSSINTVQGRWGDLQDGIRQAMAQNDKKMTEAVIYRDMHLKNTSISSYSVKEVDPDSPKVILTLQLSNESAIHKTDARIFLKTDLFSPVPPIPAKSENRMQSVYLGSGYSQVDTLIYSLPAGYVPENFVAGDVKDFNSVFGSVRYTIRYAPTTGELEIARNFTLKQGTYSKEQFASFRDFLLQSVKTICPELVLRKKG